MNLIEDFKNKPFIEALQEFFKKLNIPVDEISAAPANASDVIGENNVNELIDEVYAYGIVNDAIFEQNETFNNLEEIKSLKADYDGILLFGVTLNQRDKNLLPTRSQLSDIARAFSRTFKFTPITIVFKYGKHIAFANSERTQFKQQWREGDKIGKVSLLRDIDVTNVHSGHDRILQNLKISRSGKNAVTDFATLYKYWQEVLSVSILNKTFYSELSNWYFWAIQEVNFPNEPNQIELSLDEDAYAEALKEHKGKNVIRLLTRILFIWFIKEKGLIPEEIFDEKEIASQFIDGFTPDKPQGIFANGKYSSKYYRAILQNLFFATLNQTQGNRQFRSDGKHLNATQLMRYKSYLKNPEAFIKLMEDTVPFMNGGLFECLDKPHPTAKGPRGGNIITYNDGFSDREDNSLVVPDFLFFDAEEEVDLSKDYGNAKFKNSKTRGLINILKSYKFTITENTPIDEDVALDPELLGKVFENLLASYNPETKTTARKQTGSFYTPREIVNYMVEESLIAYLKNELIKEEVGFVELGKKQIALFGNEIKKSQLAFEQKIDENPFKDNEEALDLLLHNLVSYSAENPFEGQPEIQKKIITALDNCKILDPACGSGAYPMGILQKMVHILHKIDPNNKEWKQRQIDKVEKAIDELELLDDTEIKDKSISELKSQIKDIEASFADNDLDYGRKLYLIENCIYGVDIQPIATQISKLRFFISLVVDQKVNKSKKDFGIRPLPNLETKFVAANTLIGLDKPKEGDFSGSLFDKKEVRKLEKQLKKVRHSLFSIKSPSRKRELREEDKEIREKISSLLAEDFGNETAKLLANWDPYDQNVSSPFFDKEWMFDLSNGFDIVIGNPPYIEFKKLAIEDKRKLKKYNSAQGKYDIYVIFNEIAFAFLKEHGVVSYIQPTTFLKKDFGKEIRKYIETNFKIISILDFADIQVFDGATNYTGIFIFSKCIKKIDYQFNYHQYGKNKVISVADFDNSLNELVTSNIKKVIKIRNTELKNKVWNFQDDQITNLLLKFTKNTKPLLEFTNQIFQGIASGKDEVFYISQEDVKELKIENNVIKQILKGKDLKKYTINWSKNYVIYPYDKTSKVIPENLLKINYPNCYNYLKENRKLLNGRNYFDNSSKLWYELWNQRNHLNFDKLRIITPEISDRNNFVITDKFYGNTKTYHIIPKDDSFENYCFLLGILNSKLLDYIYKKITTPQAGGFYAYKTQFLSQLPITNKNRPSALINCVKEIISIKEVDLKLSTLNLEHQIDMMVYKLYELTYDEVLIIDPKFNLNIEEYDDFVIE
ncbi:adenine-specific DNA-methyltransferase [Flavobacterium sp. PL11]|uniref:Eco57I restriction-modification methylase domain-containing protein n=1 Tax=Flavobacterium sp. PL11 TaxID=3071717 RepID=UPI002DF81AD5|nr:adenine-specific DNA-methyltransferase [Flavobacterium sp. PL11]